MKETMIKAATIPSLCHSELNDGWLEKIYIENCHRLKECLLALFIIDLRGKSEVPGQMIAVYNERQKAEADRRSPNDFLRA